MQIKTIEERAEVLEEKIDDKQTSDYQSIDDSIVSFSE
jgi:hypothetical protein